ncbi:MAG: N-acetylglucosamine-6-phosphate deacetylase [Chitinophagaceae bacterium]
MSEAFYNCRIYTGSEVLENAAVIIEDGIIADLIPADQLPDEIRKTDLNGLNLAPSLIDLQIYGGNGKLFSNDLSVDTLKATAEYCLAGGASHFMITMATDSIEKFLEGVAAVRAYQAEGGKGLLGLHLEGPFINVIKKGAHLQEFIIRPTKDLLEKLFEKGKGVIRMMTLAPEFCEQWVYDLLHENGVIISAGHTNATFGQAFHAFDSGVPAATHLFNAMSAFQGREPGMVGAIYEHPTVMSSLVCDGVHVDFMSARISKKILGERLFFITDAVTTTQGTYTHEFRENRYTLPDGTLSGSALTMMQCVINGVKKVGIQLDEALRMASLYPARLAGLDAEMGSIKKGKKASFLLFDDELKVCKVLSF